MASTFFLYGATRSGKTHTLITLRPAGRMCALDVEGQIKAEAPDAHIVQLPPALAEGATPDQQQERLAARNEVLAEAANHDLIVWPCSNTTAFDAGMRALKSGRMGKFASLGCDSATFLMDRLISEICGVSIVHKKANGEVEDAADPVFTALPNFGDAGVTRSMELKDWGRFAIKSAEMITDLLFTAQSLNLHLVVTALEEDRDIYEGEGRNKRFIRTQRGPLMRGRITGNDMPPLFNYYFRMVSRDSNPEKGEPPDTTVHAAQTRKHNGWPAGGRGKSGELLALFEKNPNLWDMLGRLGLQG